jgi:hypothetical protein
MLRAMHFIQDQARISREQTDSAANHHGTDMESPSANRRRTRLAMTVTLMEGWHPMRVRW